MDQNKELYGFPTSVNLKYFASNFQEKQREAKQKEKELLNAAIEKEVLRIKECPWKIFSGNKHVTIGAEMKSIEEEFIDNYYVDLLKMDYLLTTKEIRSHNFKLFRLLFHFNTPFESVTKTSLASSKLAVLNNFIRLFETFIYGVKNKIENAVERCISFVHRAIYLRVCFNLCNIVQRLVVPLKDASQLRKTVETNNRNVYVLKKHSEYDLMFAILSLFWSDLPIPVVFFNGTNKSWRFSILEKTMLILIDWKNLLSEDNSEDHERLHVQLVQNLRKNRDVLFCISDDHEEEFQMLSRIVKNIVMNSVMPDLFLTTVNFSFESPSEYAIENVLLSNKKIISNDSLCNYNFNNNFGIVRAKFGTPISVKEVINSYGNDEVQKINTRLDWELSKSQILMSTDLVSFILLYKFRDGVKLFDLIKEVDLLKNELNRFRKPVGFSGNACSVVNHAMTMLSDKIATVQINNECIIKPVLRLPDVLGLARSSHNALNYFALDAVMMTCFGVLFKSKLDDIFRGVIDTLAFNYFELVEKIEQLCEILQFEFNFNNPSSPLTSEISNVIFKYIEQEYFVKNERLLTDEERWGHRLAQHLESDDEDDDYRANLGDTYTAHFDINGGDLYSKIMLYKKSLQPVLDGYLVTVEELKKSLINKQMLHSDLSKQIFLKLKDSFENDQLKYPESVSFTVVYNCIKLMEKWNVLETYIIDEIKVCFLATEYNNERSFFEIEQKVRSFL